MLKPLAGLKQCLQRALISPVLHQNGRLLQRYEETLQENSQALEQFALAIRECSEQLARHTESVRSMASAAQELRDTVGEMNRILGRVNPAEDRAPDSDA